MVPTVQLLPTIPAPPVDQASSTWTMEDTIHISKWNTPYQLPKHGPLYVLCLFPQSSTLLRRTWKSFMILRSSVWKNISMRRRKVWIVVLRNKSKWHQKGKVCPFLVPKLLPNHDCSRMSKNIERLTFKTQRSEFCTLWSTYCSMIYVISVYLLDVTVFWTVFCFQGIRGDRR